jgi:para-aminobenzoate synthetase component 1
MPDKVHRAIQGLAGFQGGQSRSSLAARANPRHRMSAAEHHEGVNRILDLVAAGDCYQVNLTHRVVVPVEGDPSSWYDALVDHHPAPFAAYLPLDDSTAIACISPERYLRVDGATVWTEPIKGTRPRDPDPDRDREAASDLLASLKDRAEHVMIVDLERNDLGRVARPGTVRVPEPFRLQANPTVWHLVTRVEAHLETGVRMADLLRATFPGGSITGAPKTRARQRIAELEGVSRGVYTGAIGYWGRDGRVDLNVAIRTAVWTGDHLHVQVGGGIVADSDPAEEWRETGDKAWGILRSLGLERSCWPG